MSVSVERWGGGREREREGEERGGGGRERGRGKRERGRKMIMSTPLPQEAAVSQEGPYARYLYRPVQMHVYMYFYMYINFGTIL